MSLKLDIPQHDLLKPKIIIFGVGGAGGNAINNMIRSNLEGVEFVAANTDAQALSSSLAPNIIQLGLATTKGLGAGSFPDRGRAAAEENIKEIENFLEGCHMVFIAAGMGGGSGTGAAPQIAKIAREMGLLTVGIVTMPFEWEGKKKVAQANAGVSGLKENSDTETFVAMKVFIDNWRWAGVPIYMRTGKKMPETVLEVLVEFKKPPRELFGRGNPNAVRFRLGAKDGVDISLLAKKPGTKLTTEEIDLTVEFVNEFGDRQGPYERLLRAAILGDHFRFTRIDAVLHSWKILEDILKSPTRVHPYFEGTWGPDEAQMMIPGGWNPVGTQVED